MPLHSAQQVSVSKIQENQLYKSGCIGCVPPPRLWNFQANDWWDKAIHKVQLKVLEIVDSTYSY